jgi:hypothetical protein
VNYAKLLEMNSFFTLHSFLEVGKTQDLPSKFWISALMCYFLCYFLLAGTLDKCSALATPQVSFPVICLIVSLLFI